MMTSQKLKWTPDFKQFMALYGKPFKNSFGFRRNSRLFGLLLLVCLLPVSSISYAVDTEPSSGDGDGASLTPLSEFAPDEVRPAKGEIYDQGLTINKISIEGNRLIEEDKIKDTMASRPGSLYSKRNLQQDLRRIYDMGYFTEKIKAVPIATNAGIHLRIELEENAPVTGVNIQGNTIIKDEEIQKIFAGQTGLPQNIGQLNESIEKIEKLYADKGFVLARVKSIADDPDGLINLEVNEGSIDKLQFVGNRKTKDNVLKRMMVIKSGDLYNEKVLSEDLKRIFNTQSFSDVRRVITASPDNPDKYNLTVELDEKKTGAISLGGGVDSLTGFFGSLGYNDPNFLGRGQSFNSGFAVGSGILLRGDGIATTRTVNVDIGWTNPSLFDSVNSLSTGVYGRYLPSFNIPYSAERRIGSDITWSRPLMSIPNMGFSLGLRGEDVHISDKINNGELRRFGISDAERRKEIKGGTFITLTPTIAYDTRDNRFNPTSGWLNTLSVGGSYGARGGSSYGTVVLNLRKYIKVRDGITLALNAQGAATPYGDIPQFNMFRLGGANDVRGYQFGGLGIGNGLLTGSAELRTKVPFVSKIKNIPMLDSLSTAFFADAGQVLSQASSDKLFDRPGFGMSIGAGLRFTIPGVGPMRVDYAIPVANSGSRYVQHFSFGVGQKF